MPSSPEHALTLRLLQLVRRNDPATGGLPRPMADAIVALRQAVTTLDDAAFELLVCDLVWQDGRDRLAAAGINMPAQSRPSALRTLGPKDRVAVMRARGQAIDDARRIGLGEAVQIRTPKVPEPREPRQVRRIGGV